MRYRKFLSLLAAALSVAIGAGAVSAPAVADGVSATSGWQEVPLKLTNPSPSMTVREIHTLAEQAAQRALPPIVKAVVYGSDQRREEDIQSILAGQPLPTVRIYKDMPTAPTTTLKDITAGTPVPSGVIPIPIPYCEGDACVIIIVLYPI